jgi:type IV pilus assembly protein PilA
MVRGMKANSRWCVVLFLACVFTPARALQSSPQEALEEMATADKIDTVLKHLPLKVEEFVKKLPAKERADFAEKFLVAKNLEREGGKLTRSDDGSAWVLLEKDGKEKTVITFKNTYAAGPEALVELEAKGERRTETIFVGMKLEDGEWRVHQAGPWQRVDLEEEVLRDAKPRETTFETAAMSTLRTLNTAMVTYTTTFPDQGCPASLQVLAGHENQEATPDHAMLLDQTFLAEPVVKDGYEFRYVRIDKEHYQITASPQRWGEGMRSLFTDETAVIRVTPESRPANANDPPLD